MSRNFANTIRWLKHAFAVDQPPVAPTEAQRVLVDRLCRAVVGRGLVTPASMALETCRPLGYLGSQTLHFFAPFLSAFGGNRALNDFAEFLSQPGAIDFLARRLEELERERSAAAGDVQSPPGAAPS